MHGQIEKNRYFRLILVDPDFQISQIRIIRSLPGMGIYRIEGAWPPRRPHSPFFCPPRNSYTLYFLSDKSALFTKIFLFLKGKLPLFTKNALFAKNAIFLLKSALFEKKSIRFKRKKCPFQIKMCPFLRKICPL